METRKNSFHFPIIDSHVPLKLIKSDLLCSRLILTISKYLYCNLEPFHVAQQFFIRRQDKKHQSWKDKGLKTEEIVVSHTQETGGEKRESYESVSERHKNK